MNVSFPEAGSASVDLAHLAHQCWIEEASRSGINLTAFDPDATLDSRIAWAKSNGLEVAGILARQSTKMQHSIESQVKENARYAAWHGMYPAPELVCVDEGVTGRKEHRAGLDRMKSLLEQRLVETLLVFKISRLFRSAYKGYQFFQEHVVEEGLRAVSISQGVDTNDTKTWGPLAAVHGVADQMLLEAISDHVRVGIAGVFLRGYVTGALPVGYHAKEVPGAPLTNLGRTRTMPEVTPDVAQLIRQHYEWIRDGMPIREGWRRWVAANGPCDPRSTCHYMTHTAYRRMLSNPRYIGCWAFGRKRNSWSSKKDYMRQIEQPNTEVRILQCEELRIMSDELFFAVQKRLEEQKLGPRGPKKKKETKLWDLVTDVFFCPPCQVRCYQSGHSGQYMSCKHGNICPCKASVKREEAVRAVCRKLIELIRRDPDLIEQVIARAFELDDAGEELVNAELARVENSILAKNKKLDDLTELAGQGTDEDRAALKAKVRAAQVERAALQAERARLRRILEADREPITPEQGREILADLERLLIDGAAGTLGEDLVYRAADAFRKLVGGRIWVHAERRAGRKRSNIKGVFRPDLIRTIRSKLDLGEKADVSELPEVEVWLRKPPKKDSLAERVHQLMDGEGLTYRGAAAALQAEGHKINSGIVWQIYRRYYEMLGQPVPERAYNNGQPREALDPLKQ